MAPNQRGPSAKSLARALIQRYPASYPEELGLKSLSKPEAEFQLLVMATLMSARISSSIAFDAAKAISAAGFTTAEAMCKASRDDRVAVLNRAGYARYQERTATMLGQISERLLQRYDGDLGRLRREAGRDAGREHELLQQFKGIGKVGANIFCREVQLAWPELYPFADNKVTRSAAELGLPADARELSGLVAKKDFPRLLDALVRLPSGDRRQLKREAA